jgi:hypothetical protein
VSWAGVEKLRSAVADLERRLGGNAVTARRRGRRTTCRSGEVDEVAAQRGDAGFGACQADHGSGGAHQVMGEGGERQLPGVGRDRPMAGGPSEP